VVDTNDLPIPRQPSGHFDRQAWAEADLEDTIAVADLQQLYGPAIPLTIRWSRRHDKANEPADDSGRLAELSDDLAPEGPARRLSGSLVHRSHRSTPG
jgi:hypothetical protein